MVGHRWAARGRGCSVVAAVAAVMMLGMVSSCAASTRYVRVPRVVGMKLAIARKEIADLGLRARIVSPIAPPPNARTLVVLSQTPLAGRQVRVGSVVTLVGLREPVQRQRQV